MTQLSTERKPTLSVLIVTDPYAETSDDALAISVALTDAGHLVLGVRAGDASLPEAVARLKPDMVVVKSDSAVSDVLEHIVMATRDARRPIVMFTDDGDRPTMRSALGAGVTAYVLKGLQPERVQAVSDVAVERFAGERALRSELDAARSELACRKTIDRAKRLLMGKKGLSEPEDVVRPLSLDRSGETPQLCQRRPGGNVNEVAVKRPRHAYEVFIFREAFIHRAHAGLMSFVLRLRPPAGSLPLKAHAGDVPRDPHARLLKARLDHVGGHRSVDHRTGSQA